MALELALSIDSYSVNAQMLIVAIFDEVWLCANADGIAHENFFAPDVSSVGSHYPANCMNNGFMI
jgi:hypothetical protein